MSRHSIGGSRCRSIQSRKPALGEGEARGRNIDESNARTPPIRRGDHRDQELQADDVPRLRARQIDAEIAPALQTLAQVVSQPRRLDHRRGAGQSNHGRIVQSMLNLSALDQPCRSTKPTTSSYFNARNGQASGFWIKTRLMSSAACPGSTWRATASSIRSRIADASAR